jgi:hypothetical protein
MGWGRSSGEAPSEPVTAATRWSGGGVEYWSGGVVEWWSGEVVEWWRIGVVAKLPGAGEAPDGDADTPTRRYVPLGLPEDGDGIVIARCDPWHCR